MLPHISPSLSRNPVCGQNQGVSRTSMTVRCAVFQGLVHGDYRNDAGTAADVYREDRGT